MQKKFYEQINLRRQEKELTHQVEQQKKRRKLQRGKAKRAGAKKVSGIPLWRKETTLIAMQRDYADAEENEANSSRAASGNNSIRNSAPTTDDEYTPGDESSNSADESDSQSEPELPRDDSPLTPEGEQSDEGENLSEDEEEETALEEHPGVVEAEEGDHTEEGRQSPDSPKSDLDDHHPRASPPKDAEAAAKTPEVSEEEPKAEAVVEEVVNLVTSEEEEEEGPMSTEEFLQK